MVYEKVRKNASSWSPAFHQEKSESLFRSRPFSIPAEADTEEAEEQPIPAYTRFERDAISANLLRTMKANVQAQVAAEGQKPTLESEEKTEETSAEAETLQRQSESPEAGDDENSSNGGTIQRQEEPAQPEDDEELSSQAGAIQLQEQPAPSEDDEELSLQARAIQLQEEPAQPEDDEELSPQAGTIQRQEQPAPSEDDEELSPQAGAIQRQEQPAHLEDEEMQPVQTKLTIGAPGDKYEQEADQMAARVMSMEAPTANPQSIQRQPEGEKEDVQMSRLAASITPLIQRFSEQDVQTKSSVQRAGEGSASQTEASLESRLSSQKGGGTLLDDEVRSFMEPRFGNDFSEVRVHTDSSAVQMNKELHAQAFTHGKDIYFNSGKYDPRSNSGKELLAHELTHTIQQTGAVQAKFVTNLATKGNKVQTKVGSVTSFDAQPVIRCKENPQQPAEKDNKVQPAKPASMSAPTAEAEVGGAKSQTPKASGNGATAAPKAESGGGKAEVSPAAPKAGSSGGAKAAQGGNQQAASSSADVGTGGVGGAKSPASPEQDPAFQAVVNKAKGVAQDKKKHDPAQAESKEAQDAAQPPANEVESKAQDKQVGEMSQQQPGEFNAEAFKAAVMEKVDQAAPKTLEEADKFKDSNLLDSVGGSLSSQAKEAAEQAAGPVEEKTKEAPDTSGIKPKEVKPLEKPEAGATPSDIGAAQATPKPKPEAEVSAPMKAESQKLDQQMAEANVTEEQLANSNEPQFIKAVGAKKEAQVKAVEAPQAYRQQEKATLNQAQSEAQTTSQTQLDGMQGQREQLLAQVTGSQDATKSKDEQERAKVATDIDGIYQKTKSDVEGILNGLDTEVTNRFKAAADTAKKKFEESVAPQMEEYKQRYDGIWGAGRWVKDKLLGVPSEVTAFFTRGRNVYRDEINTALTGIANYVAEQLNKAKQRIDEGRQKIQEYVTGLPEALQQVGTQAAQDIQSKFDELEQSVKDKETQLVDTLAQQYTENLQQLDAQIDEMKASNQPWFAQAFDAMAGAIETISKLKNMLMGVLAKAASAIGSIIKDPIGFLGNLISGIKQGFDKFAGNIEKHLQKGLMGWLTGALAGAGITMPENFDLKGIFSLVMQVLGVVYEGIKSRVIKALGKNGEKMFNALESSFEMFVILKNEGIGGLWQFLQDKIGDLKVMVIDTIQTFVVENVIKAGVLWVVSLLNPASAFVKACKAIYDIIMFFIERGSQIAQLVHAVTDSVGAIASGAVDGAAALIENALGTSLPVVISFMASLLGLGGISEKIGGIIKQVRAPIDKAIDWLISQAVKFAKKIGKALGFGKDEEDEKKNKENKKEGEQLEDSEVGKTVNFSAEGKGHRLWINTQGISTTVMVASTPTPVETKLNEWQGKLDSLAEDKRPQAQSLLATARQHVGTTEQEAQKTAKEMQEAKQNSSDEAAVAEAEQADNETEQAQQTLADLLKQLFEMFGEENTQVNIPDGPVGEPVTFNTPDEGHRLWIELKDGEPVVMVASTPEQAEVKLNNIVGQIQGVPNLPPHLLARAGELLRRGYGLLNVTEEQIDQRLDALQNNENNVDMANIRAEIDRRANSVPQRNELAHVFQELFEILYNATHLPEERSAEGAAAWYHGQMRDAMGSIDERGQDTSGFTTGEGRNQRSHQIPTMLGVVVDQENNNQAYFGMSAGGKQQPNQQRLANAYPPFQDQLRELTPNRPLTNRELTNCAEFEAYDKAFSARGRDNANLEGLKDSAALGNVQDLTYIPRCDNCEYVYGEEHNH